jgi:hypothetical protein
VEPLSELERKLKVVLADAELPDEARKRAKLLTYEHSGRSPRL